MKHILRSFEWSDEKHYEIYIFDDVKKEVVRYVLKIKEQKK